MPYSRTPTLPKDWKITERYAYMKWGENQTSSAYTVTVLLNQKGEIVTVFVPGYDVIYEEASISHHSELEFLKSYSWEPKP